MNTSDLVERLRWVRKFIEYARYELQPGEQQLGDQFPRQSAANRAMAEIDAVLAAMLSEIREPASTRITWDEQGRRLVNGRLGPEYLEAAPSPRAEPADVVCSKCEFPIRDGFCGLSCDGKAEGNAEEAYHANERIALQRLSNALTGGNASTWDEVFDAALTHLK